ncbi:MAG: CBM35 domain-containing protein, partial [Limisphaerales bacterium]
AYTLDAGDGGWFAVSARVLPSTGGRLDIGRKPFKPLTSIDIPAPGPNGPIWISVPGKSLFHLPPGEFILTARITKPGFQLGNFNFKKVSDAVVTVEAETGTITGAGVNNDHYGYKGAGFVAGIGTKSSSVTIPVNVPADGKYLLALRYANGNGDATVTVTLPGGRSVTVPLPSTDAWDNYSEVGTIVELKAGKSEILVSVTGVGVVNVDQVKLIPLP